MSRVALVSGGSGGIGQGIAITLSKRGWDVAISYNSRYEGALETKRQVEANGAKCEIIEAHLENEGAPEEMVRSARAAFGRLDAYVCNAGRDRRFSVLTTTRERMAELININLYGYILSVSEAARIMVRDNTHGSIVFITSTRAESAHPDDFLYGGIKALFDRASKSMALDLASYGIRVNCVAPGATRVRNIPGREAQSGTLFNGLPFYPIENTIPLERMGTPEDIGNACAFLLSEEASYITGATIRVDGGLALPGMPEFFAPCQWQKPGWTQSEREQMENIK